MKGKYLWAGLLFLIAIAVISIGMITGFFPSVNPMTQFFVFVFLLVVISVLAIIGAAFLGMLFSHRILSSYTFTPFEKEMLKMKRDVEEMKRDLSEMKERLESKLGREEHHP